MKNITEEKMLSKLMALCAKAEHSTEDIKKRMAKENIDLPAQQKIIDYLVEHNFIDDNRYAKLFIEDKIAFNNWGRKKIEQALWTKHIDKNIYIPILNSVDDDVFIEKLKPLLEKKQKQINSGTEYEKRAKLIKYALSKGFEMDIILKSINGEDE